MVRGDDIHSPVVAAVAATLALAEWVNKII